MSNPIKKFKALYEFSIPKDISVEKTVDNGDGTKTITTVVESTPQYFALKKPSMDDYDNSELFFAGAVQEGISAGMPIRSLLDKRYKDDGGFLSKDEQKEKDDLFKKLIELRADKIAIDSAEKNEESAAKLAEIEKQTEEIVDRLQKFSLYENSMYNTTAETRARNKTVIWWVLTLAHKKNADGTYSQLFGGATHKERLAKYAEIEDLEGDEKEFMDKCLNRSILATSIFYSTGTVSDKEIEEIEKKA